jgi:hypothetical protein
MKQTRSVLLAAGIIVLAATAAAQVTPAAPAQQPAGAKPTLKSIGMIIYPAKGQTPQQQAADEAACVTWAENQTGLVLSGGKVNVDSAARAAQQKTAGQQGPRSSAQPGCGGWGGHQPQGDAAGAAGTVAGAVSGRQAGRKPRRRPPRRARQAQRLQAATDQFKKAAAACLQGRGYTVS